MLLLLLYACSSGPAGNEWAVYRGSSDGTAYSSLSAIDTSNVSSLSVAWTYRTADADSGNRSAIQCNPLMVNGKVYVTSPKLKLIALDPGTGTELWKFDPFNAGNATGVNRGVTYWEDGDEKRIFISGGQYLYALNADNGNIISSFGDSGRIDLREHLGRDKEKLVVWSTSPGIIYQDLLIQGTALNEGYDAAPGFIRAYDVRSGKLVWKFHTIPQPGEYGYETWDKDSYQKVGGANAWAGMSLDKERGIVYVPTGSAAFDFYGANRKGDNLFANCLLALEASTGKRIWHFQFVHHDLWDYDLPAQPVLMTVTSKGERVDAVAQVTKMGMVFVFDRVTGAPLFEIEERPVPASTLIGEHTSPTQPFPVKPKPFSRQFFDESEITNISPESHAFISQRLQNARMGTIFTPPDTVPLVQLPGTRGGAEWGGAAADENGILYVNANEAALFVKMKRVSPRQQNELLAEKGVRLYQQHNCSVCHGADRKGIGNAPALIDVKNRLSSSDLKTLLQKGKGQMPSFASLSDEEIKSIEAFLFDKADRASNGNEEGEQSQDYYVHDGWNFLNDQFGYPGIKPPWGTLNAIDLNRGEIVWQIPFGEYPELIAKGLPPTGTLNLGGPIVTKGGLLVIGATRDEKIRIFNKRNGKLLWEYQLPAGGYATPSTYEWNGEQYIIIAAGGGGKVGTKSADHYVAFKLKK